MAKNLRVRIHRIDPYGYNGRDHHPDRDMIGMYATVLRLTIQDSDDPVLLEDLLNIVAIKPNDIVQCFECITDDGRVVELMDHEIEFCREVDDPMPTGPIVARHAKAYHTAITSRFSPQEVRDFANFGLAGTEGAKPLGFCYEVNESIDWGHPDPAPGQRDDRLD